MLLQQKLNNFKYLFIILLFCLVSNSVKATEIKWEVAIAFRGESEDEQFQKDIDKNILELSRLIPSSTFKLGIYREMNGKSYIYSPTTGLSKKDVSLSDLVYRQDLKQYKIPGILQKNPSADLRGFLKSFYKDINAKKALIIYSHGKGADGLLGLSTKDLKVDLTSAPHLDLLWFDACFMANLEFLYEIKDASEYTIASEETEFTSGLPFQTLSLLPTVSTAKEAALLLAKNFIESYSYLKNGVQRSYVSVSSATISVVENKNLDILTNSLKNVSSLYKGLSDDQKIKLGKNLKNTASMDDQSMIDLGTFLIQLRQMNTITAQDNKLTTIIRLLNIEAVKNLKTNPRIHISVPNNSKNIQMVFGFNVWATGSKKDFSEGEIFSSILKNDGFIDGPRNAQWPLKKTIGGSELIITPFAPGINVFDYYFVDADNGHLLTEAQNVSRTHDVVETLAATKLSPLVYSAYTQQIGTKAERYTGLNITMPGTVPSLDYFELNFNKVVQWLSL